MFSPFRTISDSAKYTLKAKFQERVSFDKAERLLYSHDLGSPPALLKPLISYRQAEGVVQLQDEDELIYLLKLANRHKIPLTPRGKGTSGYGGAMPRYGGLVLDFTRMNKIIAVDPGKLTVTTGPGVVWLDLENKLATDGLALRLYPGSAPSSTVAGWLAQGGSGFGSFAYGWFGDNVVSARVVEPDGKVVVYSADKLDMVKDIEGITGFISEVTLKVMQAKTMEVLTASFSSADQLSNLLQAIVKRKYKLWSVSFINPRMGQLRDKVREQEQSPLINQKLSGTSGTFLTTFAASGVRSKQSLKQLIHSHQGRILERKLTDKLWAERFEILKIRKLAPSLISTKVAVPLESLKVVLENSHSIKHPLAIEGVILQEKNKSAKAVLLGFIPHNERKISYNIVYALALSFIKLAIKVKGRPCATGIYFKHQAARIIGSTRLARLIDKKKIIDPQNILNPGKVIAGDVYDFFMGIAWNFEPLIRFTANLISPLAATGPSSIDDKTIIPWHAFSCDQCGFCVKSCPSFQGWESQSQRGRWYILRSIMQGRIGLDQVIDKFQPCSECENCKVTCPQGLPPITPEMLGGMYV